MKKIVIITFWLVSLFVLMGCSNSENSNSLNSEDIYEHIYEGIEFDMPRVTEPTFPDYSVSITEFGAVGDGQTLNTESIAKAIDLVAKKGGGKVIIPRGIWLTGPIILKSNINIHVLSGALVLFSKNKDLYPLIETSYEGRNSIRCLSPISGRGLENIAFTGEGVFDGSGEVWRKVKREKMTNSQWDKLLSSGGLTNEKGNEWYPSEEFKRGEEWDKTVPIVTFEDHEKIKDHLRPVMVSLVQCKNVLFDGPVFQNSPSWNIHPLMCENLIIRNIDVRNPWYSQNGDGLDIESCKNGIVYNCTFDVGDDAICIKSGRDKNGRDRGMPTENIIVKNCVVYHGHGGVTVGSEMSGGVKDIHVSNCTFIGTDVGLRFKSTRGRGGVVEKIYISNIDMINIPTKAISFNLYYGGQSVSEMLASEANGEEMPKDLIFEISDETPQFKDISIENVTCKGALQAIYLQGLPEMNLENIVLKNLVMEAKKGLDCIDANGIVIENLKLKISENPALNFFNSKNVSINGLEVIMDEQPTISMNGEKTEKVNIKLKSEKVKVNLYLSKEVNPNSVRFSTKNK